MATKKQPAKTPQTKKQGPTRGRASPPTHPAVTSFASQDPAKGIAVATTIGAQLIYERRWPPNDTNKVMGSDYRYNRETVSNFLRSVRWHLTYGNPQYFFDFDMRGKLPVTTWIRLG